MLIKRLSCNYMVPQNQQGDFPTVWYNESVRYMLIVTHSVSVRLYLFVVSLLLLIFENKLLKAIKAYSKE